MRILIVGALAAASACAQLSSSPHQDTVAVCDRSGHGQPATAAGVPLINNSGGSGAVRLCNVTVTSNIDPGVRGTLLVLYAATRQGFGPPCQGAVPDGFLGYVFLNGYNAPVTLRGLQLPVGTDFCVSVVNGPVNPPGSFVSLIFSYGIK